MAYSIGIRENLQREVRRQPREVRLAFYAAIMRILDHRPRQVPQWGQLEFSLKDEYESDMWTYFEIEDGWTLGYVTYRWNPEGLAIDEAKWPQRLVTP